MSRIITFLGHGCTNGTVAIAAAKWFAQQGKRVLLATQRLDPSVEMLLGTPLNTYPQVIADNLQVVQLQTTVLLEQVWDELKQLVASYLPTTFAEDLYPGELLILPGFDSVLAFNALRQYYMSGDYDVIIYDGEGDKETLRLLGIPNALDWYFGRSGKIFDSLDLSKIAASFGGPLASAILTANIDSQKLQQGRAQVRQWIDQGIAVVSDRNCLTAYLVTTDQPGAIAATRWLWGSAQQINLSVSGIIAYNCQLNDQLQQTFTPLVVASIPALSNQNWDAIIQALPDFNSPVSVPQSLTIDLAQQQILVFLPGFNRKQVKLTQYGSEIVIDAGDQRRRISLPPELQGQPIKAGKFEEPYLIISL